MDVIRMNNNDKIQFIKNLMMSAAFLILFSLFFVAAAFDVAVFNKALNEMAPFICCVCFILLVIFVIIVVGTKYVSLGSVMCALLYPLLLSRFGGVGVNVIMAFMITILVVVMHRGNIKRILDKTESKISFSKKNIKDAEEKGNADNGNENKKK